MKKGIFFVSAACVAAAFVSGCSSCSGPTLKDDGYAALNNMLAMNYSKIELTVENEFEEGLSLKSVYDMNFTANGVTVTYSVERLGELSIDSPTDSLKTVLEGTAVIVDGVVVSINGDDASISADIADTGLNFKEEYFENAELTGVYLFADVKNPSAFIGASVDCTDMTVRATFLEVLYDVKINYTAKDGNSVEIKYVFDI